MTPRDPLTYIDTSPFTDDSDRYEGVALVWWLLGVVVIAVLLWPDAW